MKKDTQTNKTDEIKYILENIHLLDEDKKEIFEKYFQQEIYEIELSEKEAKDILQK